MGLTQHRNAVATIREVINLHLLLGAIGREGAGLCPVRGHSNVQGDRTMGIFEKMPESFLAALDRECGIHSPRKHGYDTVAAIHAMHRGDAKVFFALGGNFLQAAPDTDYTAAALRRCDLTVHISTKLNRSHLVTGRTALILPCLGRSERDGNGRFVTCENSMGVVQMSRGVLAPASADLLGEVEIIARVAAAVEGAASPVPWLWLAEDYDRIRSLIEQVVPGFENYNSRAIQGGGFYLPNSAKQRRWDTPTGKAVFSLAELSVFEVARERLILQTLRSHDQFNTTIYGMDDRYRGISNARRIILVNPEDLKARAISPCSLVDIVSIWGDERRTASNFTAIPYEMPRGCAAAYFPEANVLVPVGSQAEGSGTPTSKAVEIEIFPSGE
jgi:molybdopterin-dependent oxidoreductase alpha subunit